MGNSKSKNKRGPRGKAYGKNGRNGYANDDEAQTVNEEEYEDIELLLMRKTIERNPENFVLNNLMMCVQFFRNYEEEIDHVKKTLVSSREEELNERLPAQKHVLLPDVLQEHVTRNVGFTSMRQTFRPTIEPLQPVRIYTVHDNVEIVEQNSPSYYSRVNDSIMYNILLKPTAHQGYVQLELLEEFGMAKHGSKDEGMELSSIAENEDELYSDGDSSIYGFKATSSSLRPQREPKRGTINRNLKYGRAMSLANFNDEEELEEEDEFRSESRNNFSHLNRNVEMDFENGSAIDERRNQGTRFRNEGPRGDRDRRREKQQLPRAKVHGSGEQSLTSSLSSGYRSDNYTDSNSSCNNLSQQSRSENSSNEEEFVKIFLASAELPDRCFKRVTYTPDGKIYDPRDEKKQLLNSKQRRIKLALRRHNYDLFYASSTVFMQHFMNLFDYRLAKCLGFDQESVEDRRREGCVLYCDKIMVLNNATHSRVEQYEIIPAIWLQWPICAQEWLDRPRSTWPNYDDVEKIKDCGCYVVPEGFVPKRGNSNLNEDLEWQLTFPTGERYLETCMTQAQVQVYLITLMLHKTFMRPVFDSMFGLTTAHIRHKLFWMIEEHDRPSKWPVNRMGECLLTLLDSLYRSISQNDPTLRDYFIRERNLFQRVPSEHMLHTQKQLKRITENPVMYVFHAMENIRYSENFFPRLDFTGLLKILTADTLTLINPALVKQVSKPVSQSREEYASDDEKFGTAGFWEAIKKQRKRHDVQFVTDKTLINPRKATDSIIEISIRCAELEGPRLCALLDFFVRHFIKIAERCNQYGADQQKTIYLDHADRLSIILFEYKRYKNDARAYRDKIKLLRRKSVSSWSKEDQPPETPKRNPETAIFVAPLRDRFAQETHDDASISSSETGSVERSRKQSTRSIVDDVRNANEANTTRQHSSDEANTTRQHSSATESKTVKPKKFVKIMDRTESDEDSEFTYI